MAMPGSGARPGRRSPERRSPERQGLGRRGLLGAAALAAARSAAAGQPAAIDPGLRAAWRARWHLAILAEAENRTCDSAMGEEIGWLIAPVLEGFYGGYRLTGEPVWIDRLMDWAWAWSRRGVTEPDGYPGWPKVGAAEVDVDNLDLYADSLLGEAMVLRPIVLGAAAALRDPALAARHGAAARVLLALARLLDEKWRRRGAWRATAGGGAISLALPYGLDLRRGRWTAMAPRPGELRSGISHPTNKANLVALWLLAMTDATGDPAYRARAAAWFRLMRARLDRAPDGTFRIWDYWRPAGPWDYRAPGVPRHWIGVHPNPGYYEIDVRAMVAAFEHGVVFGAADIAALARTGVATGRFWAALAPYDATIRADFERHFRPDGWEGLRLVPWYLAGGGKGEIPRSGAAAG